MLSTRSNSQLIGNQHTIIWICWWTHRLAWMHSGKIPSSQSLWTCRAFNSKITALVRITNWWQTKRLILKWNPSTFRKEIGSTLFWTNFPDLVPIQTVRSERTLKKTPWHADKFTTVQPALRIQSTIFTWCVENLMFTCQSDWTFWRIGIKIMRTPFLPWQHKHHTKPQKQLQEVILILKTAWICLDQHLFGNVKNGFLSHD